MSCLQNPWKFFLLKLVERVVAIVFGEKVTEGSPQEIMSNPKVVNAYLGERRE